MKKVLISIQPQWCELIASGKKMIEVRKTRPKIETPFKCYIYCSKGKTFLYKNPNNGELFLDSNGGYRGGDYEDRFLTGKVIGEFVCDKIEKIDLQAQCTATLSERWTFNRTAKQACLTAEQLNEYLIGNNGYGWHITEPKLFDQPRELCEFCVPCKEYDSDKPHCGECAYYSYSPNDCGDAQEECLCGGSKPLRRPPQSWCRVEDKKEVGKYGT